MFYITFAARLFSILPVLSTYISAFFSYGVPKFNARGVPCFDRISHCNPLYPSGKNSQRGKLPPSPGDFTPAVTSLSGNTLRDRSGTAGDPSRRQSMPFGRGGGNGSSGVSGGRRRDIKVHRLLEGKLRTDVRSHTRSGVPTPYSKVGVDSVRFCD